MTRYKPKSKKLKGNVPRRRQNNSLPSNISRIDDSNRVIKATFRVAPASYSASNTGGTVSVFETNYGLANMGARAIAFGDLYKFYRIVGFRMDGKAHPGTLSTTNVQVAGNCTWYTACVIGDSSSYTAPTTIAQFVDFPHLAWMNDFNPNNMGMVLHRKDLLTAPRRWYQTVSTGAENMDFLQICFTVLSQPLITTATASTLEIINEFDVEFSGPIDPALIPLAQRGPVRASPYFFDGKEHRDSNGPSAMSIVSEDMTDDKKEPILSDPYTFPSQLTPSSRERTEKVELKSPGFLIVKNPNERASVGRR